MFRSSYYRTQPKDLTCPECDGSRFLFKSGSIKCTNCGHVIKTAINKYGAKKTEFNGKKFDSKFEASVAQSLEARKQVGDIKDYETQYRIEGFAYTKNGEIAFPFRHKVDFRIHHNDGSFELHEAKGVETDDYKWRRKLLENIWLKEHPDHIYTVVKQRNYKK